MFTMQVGLTQLAPKPNKPNKSYNFTVNLFIAFLQELCAIAITYENG